MGVTDRVWGALTAIIKLEDKVNRKSEAMKSQQTQIENLAEWVIRLETQLDMLMQALLVPSATNKYFFSKSFARAMFQTEPKPRVYRSTRNSSMNASSLWKA